jgi:Zn finger protein HypA/HybF involved in hydrogenase expression
MDRAIEPNTSRQPADPKPTTYQCGSCGAEHLSDDVDDTCPDCGEGPLTVVDQSICEDCGSKMTRYQGRYVCRAC